MIFGLFAVRLRLPALVGCLLAGVIIGTFTPGFVAEAEIASQLTEIGVMLLMFGVGLHSSLDDLLAVRKIAVPGAVVQMSFATALGMVMRESEFRDRAAQESLPLRDALAVLFFVSVGMLLDPWVLLERPLQVLAVVGIIVVGKTLAAGLLVTAFRYPLNTALTVSASLAQIGEFLFILVGLAAALGLLPPEGQSLVVTGALISIALNPLFFRAIEPLQHSILARSTLARMMEARDEPTAELPATTDARYLSRHVVRVGYGRLGQRIAAALAAGGVPFVVAEQNRETVERLGPKGWPRCRAMRYRQRC